MTETENIIATAVVTLVVLLLPLIGIKLIQWAKKRKTAAVIFGAAVQMVLPDPNVEKTIKIVQEQKKEHKKQQEDGKLK